ncbi:unnamed protein product, partial [Ceratitis capitata]
MNICRYDWQASSSSSSTTCAMNTTRLCNLHSEDNKEQQHVLSVCLRTITTMFCKDLPNMHNLFIVKKIRGSDSSTGGP